MIDESELAEMLEERRALKAAYREYYSEANFRRKTRETVVMVAGVLVLAAVIIYFRL